MTRGGTFHQAMIDRTRFQCSSASTCEEAIAILIPAMAGGLRESDAVASGATQK
jgi:hypothetical protein